MIIKKYKKKPITIEAIQVTRQDFEKLLYFLPLESIGNFKNGEFTSDKCYMEIITLEGILTANEGDYIAKGIKGEIYPIKEEIFNLTYDEIKEPKE